MKPSSLSMFRIRHLAVEALALALLAFSALLGAASAQERSAMLRESVNQPPANAADAAEERRSLDESGDDAVTIFPHSQTARWWVSGQSNIVLQAHPDFRSPYSGPNSLQGE